MTRVSSGVDVAAVLKDPESDRLFREDGFVVIPLVPAAALAALRVALDQLVPEDRGPFFGLYRNDHLALRRRLDATVRHHLEGPVLATLHRQRIYIGSVLVKYPEAGTHLALHQDWSFVDESRFVSGAVWVALEDVDRTLGGLRVVPGSHRLDLPYRGTPAAPSLDEATDGSTVVDLAVPAGHAVIYHNALIHGSSDNVTSRRRTVAVLGFVSEDAEMVHFHVDDAGQRWRYRITDDRSFHYQPPAAPSGPTVLGVERWDDDDDDDVGPG